MKKPLPGNGNIIAVHRLTKKFGKLEAVKGISFHVKRGEVFAFLGPNGAGKTTTIKMLTTLLKPSTGEILINGSNPATNPQGVRKSFGIVFQDPSLDDELTAWENLEIHGILYDVPRKVRRERMEQLLKIAELWERKDDFVKTFSGGMRRRLEIARGILHHPSIIFLDEPTVGLDPQTRNHLWAYIKKLNKEENVTVFFTTHYMEEADRMAERIAVIDHGAIIAEGTPESLKKKTRTKTLEDAFLKLTGHAIRHEASSGIENFRMHSKMWGKR
jgi:ABC-2 type transport system ATP-binding protein